MWNAIKSQFWPAWHRQIAAALLLAMIWTEFTGEYSQGTNESSWSNWFEYPAVFWTYSFVWFVLFVMEQWDPGPFTRVRFCYLLLFLGLFAYGIIRPLDELFEGFGVP